MGSEAKRNRIHLLRGAVIVLVAGAAAGCSSNFTRFDKSLYTSAAESTPATAANPYPGDVDTTTTASVGAPTYGPTPYPVNDVVARPDHTGYVPDAASDGVVAGQPIVSYTPPSNQPVQRTALANPTVINAPATDDMTTASIVPARIAPQKPVSGERGWTGEKGTAVTVAPGETVYNLSKRYGVPVSAILKANKMTDASHLEAGQTIIIPAFVYGENVPVSAPDNDPKTRYASASRGALYAPDSGRVPVPQQSPVQLAGEVRAAPTTRVDSQPNSTVDPIQTGSTKKPANEKHKVAYVQGYVVKSGDTLSKIAAAHNVRVNDLRAANGLKGDNLRIGQELAIPSGTKRVAEAVPEGVDPIITGSSDKPATGSKPKSTSASDAGTKVAANDSSAPAQTGIGDFRWPVRGRVIANFGDKTDGGRNDGIDISVPEGTAVKAAENGVVVYSGSELEGFGNLILVRHSDGWVSAYAHNKSLEVNRGDEVRRGQVIARSGRSGSAEMPKLHFELRKNSVPVDPLKHLG